MLDHLTGTPRRLDVGFVPSPSGGQMHFWIDEEVGNSYVVLLGYAPDLYAPDRVEALALVTGWGCVQSVFGYPNEDAFWKDPRGALGHGCYEIEGSSWETNIQAYNRRSFGADVPFTAELHHYFIGSKDGSCQILARSIEVEVFPRKSRREVVEIVNERDQERFRETLRRIQQMQERGPE